MAVSFPNLTSLHPPRPIFPIHPDFAYCHSFYGSNVDFDFTRVASAKLPEGNEEQQYELHNSSSKYHLPFTSTWQKVTFSVEASVSITAAITPYIKIRPKELRGMAAYLSQNCLDPYNPSRRTGGFITKRINGLISHILDPNVDIKSVPYPSYTTFLTVTMLDNTAHSNLFLAPGDRDPQIPSRLSDAETNEYARQTSMPESERMRFWGRAIMLAKQSAGMWRGLQAPWWLFLWGESKYEDENEAGLAGETAIPTNRKR